jgi:hypothetical protein
MSIRRERLSAELEGEFVVFLIGMRINRLWRVDKWGPVARSMGPILTELKQRPELGFLHGEMWFSRTILFVQYWRSMAQLQAYAQARDAAHLPAWSAFNKAIGTDGSVGIWHETYASGPGRFESVYVNMPPFGLGRAGSLHPATGQRRSAAGRLQGRIEEI